MLSNADPAGSAGPEPERLPLRVKLAYGAPSFAGAGMAIPIVIHLTIFYSDTILVPLGFIALVKAVARAFDALTDPLMGWITDRTRTRWGRRRPWMIVGPPLAALAFIALFAVPDALTPTGATIWFAVAYTSYYLFHTVYEIPHGGLGPELTLDYNERTSLFGWRVPFLVGGTLVAAILPPALIGYFGDARSGYVTFAVIFGVLLVLLYINLVVNVQERPDFANRAPNPLVPGVRRVMRNRAFRVLLLVYVTGSVTGAIPGLMMPYFTKYVLQPENPDMWLGIFLAIYFGSGFLFLPLWMLLARKLGKKNAWLISFVPGITGSIGIFALLGKGDLMMTAAILTWTGAAFSAGMLLGPSIQADVIDYDELYTGRRREAQYNGLWSVMTKFTVIPSMALPLAILAAYGYQPNIVQTEQVQDVIRTIFGLAPALTAVVALVIATRFPINQKVHEQIWVGIRSHQRGEPAFDPLTQRMIPPPLDRGVPEDVGWFLDHFSPRELARVLSRGTATLIRSSVLALALSLGVTGLATWVAFQQVSELTTEPGIMTVFAVVTGGFAFTAACFHVFRVRAALRMQQAAIAPETIQAHLRFTEFFTGGTGQVAKVGVVDARSAPQAASE